MNWPLYFLIGFLVGMLIITIYMHRLPTNRSPKSSTILFLFIVFILLWPILLISMIGTLFVYWLVLVIFWLVFDHEWSEE